MKQFPFHIPDGMSVEDAAKAFNAYLMGSIVSESNGPRRKAVGNDADWQLDETNDFWLHVREDATVLTCRFSNHEPVLEAMIALFTLRYDTSMRMAA